MSTLSALNVNVRERKPATVTKVPVPSLSILRRRSLPFWAAMGKSFSRVIELGCENDDGPELGAAFKVEIKLRGRQRMARFSLSRSLRALG